MTLTKTTTDLIPLFTQIAQHYGLAASTERLKIETQWNDTFELSEEEKLEQLASKVGLRLSRHPFHADLITPLRLPLVIYFENHTTGILEAIDRTGTLHIRFTDENGQVQALSLETLEASAKEIWVMRPTQSQSDVRVDEYIQPYRPNWFKDILLHDKKRYIDLFMASIFANVLALATTIFSMQIYDRVVPAQSYSTLWVLFIGIFVAISFEFILRIARASLSDHIGKLADARISDVVFGHALRIRTEARSTSTGSFISQLRELEQIREMITSSTMGALLDLPFVLLFIFILWYLGGALVWIPLAVIPLLVIVGMVVQIPLAKLSQQGMRESALRNALLIEVVQRLEDIKLLRAEQRFQNLWNQVNDTSASIQKKQKAITNFMLTWTQSLQSLTFVGVLMAGSYLVIEGHITTGVLVGTSMLSSRMIAPIAQWTHIFARFQNMKVAYNGLNALMQRPVEQSLEETKLQRPIITGTYQLDNVAFAYDPQAKRPNLHIPKLLLPAGSKVGVVGKMGSGKSTLLNLIAGLYRPTQGTIHLDGDIMDHIDQGDIRKNIGFLSQQAQLFYGTVRKNLMMGNPMATPEDLQRALEISGALEVVQSLPDGLDYLLKEGGLGLSGGQKQALLLARLIISDPSVVLMDEPTANMDDKTERQVVKQLETWLKPKTVFLATHKPQTLQWVTHLLVMDKGTVVYFDDKKTVLSKLNTTATQASAEGVQA